MNPFSHTEDSVRPTSPTATTKNGTQAELSLKRSAEEAAVAEAEDERRWQQRGTCRGSDEQAEMEGHMIDVDHSYADNGSGYDSEETDGSTSRSLATIITNYRYENGRRYHSYRDGQYYQPNDQKHIEVEVVVHHLWLLTLNDKLFLAPIQNPERILDIGTGIGLWAVDIADFFPEAEVIATDLSPIQVSSAPPNVRFEIDDCSSEWTYPPESIDFVHARALVGSLSSWPDFYEQCLKHLRPGGYLEQLEYSMRVHSAGNDAADDTDAAAAAAAEEEDDDVVRLFCDRFIEAGERVGKDFEIADKMAGFLREAGFVDVVESRYAWPIGPWASDERLKDIGRWNSRNFELGMEGWSIALFTRYLEMTYEEVQDVLRKLKAAVRDRSKHYFCEVRVVYGRKPST